MKKWLLVAICGIAVAMAADGPSLKQVFSEFDAHLAQLRSGFERRPAAPQDKDWVQAKLQNMADIDQYMRKFPETAQRHGLSGPERFEFDSQYQLRFLAVDRRNTADLKQLLQVHSWFTISEFGASADSNAWLLVQHADDDPAFQKQILKVLEPLALQGETKPSNFAYLFDRVALSYSNPARQTPQRYGTQGRCTGPGTWQEFPVEDPAALDQRRATVGLMPIAEYRKFFKDICHESQEETIRKAVEVAKPRT